eukprot:150205-Rhodomonas_salina.1
MSGRRLSGFQGYVDPCGAQPDSNRPPSRGRAMRQQQSLDQRGAYEPPRHTLLSTFTHGMRCAGLTWRTVLPVRSGTEETTASLSATGLSPPPQARRTLCLTA